MKKEEFVKCMPPIKQVQDFIYLLFDYGYSVRSECELESRKIRIHFTPKVIVEKQDEIVRVSIDPSYCFDSANRCSIHAYFPMKKREYNSFLKFMDRIFDEKSVFSKRWQLDAVYYRYGSYAQYGPIHRKIAALA